MSNAPKQPPAGTDQGIGSATVVAESFQSVAPSVAPGTPSVAPAATSGPVVVDLVNTVLADRYRIVKKLGEGGMGSVYLAEHTTINKKLAIKVLSPEYSHKQDLVDRFLQEARAASMIDQENVVEITDFGATPNGSVFFVMEYLNGEDLSDTIKDEGKLPWDRAAPIMLQIVDALEAAHAAGIIHRDMKPENCFRLKRGSNHDFIKVLDFGIAKVTTEDGDGGGKNLTRTGMIFGTPEYMSPEQAKGEKVDTRVDVYALGVILYEMLTGRVPFTADTFMGILTKHMFEPPAAPSVVVPDASIPPEVEAIILKALQKDREYRFQSMAEVREAILAVGSGSGAVNVVDEVVSVPLGGETSFKSHAQQLDDEPARSNTGLLIGLGLAAAVAVGFGGFIALGGLGDDDDANPAITAQATAGQAAESATPSDSADASDSSNDSANGSAAGAQASAGEPDGTDTPPANAVSVTFSTPGIDGAVFDNRDDSELGKTNVAIEMPRSTDSFDAYVRAEGYEDFLMDVIPDRDKKVAVTLTKVAEPADDPPPPSTKKRKKGSSKRGSKKGSSKKGQATSSPPPDSSDTGAKDPPPDDGKKKKKGKDWDTVSGDLKNPFGK